MLVLPSLVSQDTTNLAQPFLHTSNNSGSARASSLWLGNDSCSNACNVGNDLRALDEAAAVGEGGELYGGSNLIVVAGN